MQNLTITCEAVNSIDSYSSKGIEVQLSNADLDFLDSIPLKDVLRNLDALKLLQEYDTDDIISYLEGLGYETTSNI